VGQGLPLTPPIQDPNPQLKGNLHILHHHRHSGKCFLPTPFPHQNKNQDVSIKMLDRFYFLLILLQI